MDVLSGLFGSWLRPFGGKEKPPAKPVYQPERLCGTCALAVSQVLDMRYVHAASTLPNAISHEEVYAQIDHLMALGRALETEKKYMVLQKSLEHHQHITALTDACNQGCCVCRTFWHHHRVSDPDRCSMNTQLAPNVSDTAFDPSAGNQPTLTFHAVPLYKTIRRGTGDEPGQSIKFVISERREHSSGSVFIENTGNLTVNTVCRDCRSTVETLQDTAYYSLATVKEWLDTCLSEHSQCRSADEDRQQLLNNPADIYTGRLMDLGHAQLPSDQWRLIDTGEEGFRQYRYMTLSHRWASYEPILLNATTEGNMRRGMPVANLPAVYQDAVKIARAVNVRYLWIDTICVFQDNSLDIQSAACNMAAIYNSSLCNIVGLTARSDGLLKPCDEFRLLADTIVCCRHQSRLFSCCNISHDGLWRQEVIHMPLLERGWIAQEQLLPPHALLCGARRLFWQCETLKTQEMCVESPSTGFPLREYEEQMDLQPYLHPRNGKIRPQKEILDKWRTFITHYNYRQLTNVQDRLLAISGMAKQISRVYGLRYVAGHWEDHFPEDLCWSTQVVSRSPPRLSVYPAPTWSWASAYGLITWAPLKCQLARYMGVSVTTQTGTPFGLIEPFAFLKLRGILLPLTQISGERGDEYHLAGLPGFRILTYAEPETTAYFHDLTAEYYLLVLGIWCHTGSRTIDLTGLGLRKLAPRRRQEVTFSGYGELNSTTVTESFRRIGLMYCHKNLSFEDLPEPEVPANTVLDTLGEVDVDYDSSMYEGLPEIETFFWHIWEINRARYCVGKQLTSMADSEDDRFVRHMTDVVIV